MVSTLSVGILGASGFAGSELLRLLATHPDFDVRLAGADSQAGVAVADLYPGLAAAYPDLEFTAAGAAECAGLDVVFLGLPHGLSQSIVPDLRGTVKWIIDAASDFRLKDPALYPKWYGAEHPAPELLVDAAYGIPAAIPPPRRQRPTTAPARGPVAPPPGFSKPPNVDGSLWAWSGPNGTMVGSEDHTYPPGMTR